MKPPKNVAVIGNGVHVSASGIPDAGFGLFASRRFKRGEWITLYDGEVVTRKEAWRRDVRSHIASRDGTIVDGIKTPRVGRGGGSFANCSLNAKSANAVICAWLGLLFVKAVCAIETNQEITVYYGRRGLALSCHSRID